MQCDCVLYMTNSESVWDEHQSTEHLESGVLQAPGSSLID